MIAPMHILLASSSEPRAQLLRQAGYRFVQRATGAPEDLPKASFPTPAAYCMATCRLKAEHLIRQFDPSVFDGAADEPHGHADGAHTAVGICGDTIVVGADNEILEKPETRQHAKQMLMSYSGRTVTVHTATILVDLCAGAVFAEKGLATRVSMRGYGEAEVDAYLAEHFDECRTGSGAIKLAGSSMRWVEAIDGDYENAVGLCVEFVRQHV